MIRKCIRNQINTNNNDDWVMVVINKLIIIAYETRKCEGKQ